MTQTEVCLPKLGESILSATVVQWFKKEGDWVEEDEPLLEVATDKVNSEIPAPVAGKLVKILAEVDQTIDVGAPLVMLSTDGAVSEDSEAIPAYHSESHGPAEATTGFLSPAVLRLVRERNIPLNELDKITGSGVGGRITKRDIESYAVAKGTNRKQQTCQGSSSHNTDVTREKMSPMRKAIAENMARSFYEAPHAYILTEVDVTDRLAQIAQEKEAFLKEHGAKLTITSHVVKAIADAVSQFPLLNASLEEDMIVKKKSVNVGIAVAVDNGLVVPVIKGCEALSIPEIAKSMADISTRARAGRLQPDEVSGGTITLTNFGMSGATIGLPIIRHPEVGIVGVGAIKKQVAVQSDDTMAIRSIFSATLSFDHRIIDGMYAGAFLKVFRDALQDVQ